MRKEIGILLMAVLLAVPLWGCQRSRDTVPEKTVPKATLPKQTAPGKEDPGDQTETIPALDAVSDRGQLMAGAESRQKAEELARLYGITLVDYQHQVALLFTEEDPGEVIQRGKDNGWPELSLNRMNHSS